tara:strand:- start:180 stop:437 length:258 start_codon:yes stop_codon:yes gene_type:complete
MATGDVTLSLAVEGGVTKTVVLDSAIRALSRARIAAGNAPDEVVDTDVKWQVVVINMLGKVILSQANAQAQSEASWTHRTFTEAT